MQHFSFSDSSINVCHLSNENVILAQPTIIFNASADPLKAGNESIAPRTSIILENGTIQHAENAVLITSHNGFSPLLPYPHRDDVMKNWTHVHDIFPLPHLENTNLWRSPKEHIGNVSYNLWFATKETDCGIHNTHDFLEVHTQIWGVGHMQKFHENDAATIYEDIVMLPGFTHAPFCGEHDHLYPWHRYYADTDCIWLAVEYNDEKAT